MRWRMCDKDQNFIDNIDLKELLAIERAKNISLRAELVDARARIAELEAAAAWIPVGERHPAEGEEVEVVIPGRGVSVVEYKPCWIWCYAKPTHWRPMPELPEGKK
jgi:hypothetical protein